MANWTTTLRLSDVYRYTNDLQALAGIVATRLRDLALPVTTAWLCDDRDGIADAFQDLADDPCTSADEFDGVMAWLYSWADTPLDGAWNGQKLCWVDTRGNA